MRFVVERGFVSIALVIAVSIGCGGATPPPQATAEEKALLQELADLHSSRRYDDGLDRARSYLEEHPDANELNHAIAVFQGSQGQHHAAIVSFEKELELNDRHLASHLGLGLTFSMLGEHERALEHLEIAQQLAPDDTRVGFQRGSVLSKLGRFDDAERQLFAVKKDLDTPAVDYELALIAQRKGNFEEAANRFRDALEKDEQHLPAVHGLAQALLRLGRQDDGQKLLVYHQRLSDLLQRRSQLEEVCRSETATPEICVELAKVHLHLGKDSAARVAFERALQINSGDFTAALGLGALLLRMEDFKGASQWTIQALTIAPDHPRPYFILGLVRVSKGENEAADKALAISRTKSEWSVDNYLLLGTAWLKAGEFKRAISTFRDGLVHNRDHVALLRGLSKALLADGDSVSCDATANRLLQLQPQNQDAWLLMAAAKAQQGDLQAAKRAFNSAVGAAGPLYDQDSARRHMLARLAKIPGGADLVEAF